MDTGSRVIAILALIASAAALFLGVVAYNRSGRNLDEEIQAAVDVRWEQVRISAARAEAASNLALIRARLIAGETYEEVADDFDEVHGDLSSAYEGASAEFQTQWNSLESGLNEVENEVRNDTADALSDLASLINSLEEDIRT
ncbi:MAG: hypothetical protein PHG63_02655 [Candidatus Dojkabacteria bacterium]|nr:hypothetical protein [Candidatus Dojkabacteria bacterium]